MIEISLRRDQAECALEALNYICARFDGHGTLTNEPAVRLACRLAKHRASEVADIIRTALADPTNE